MVVVTNKMPVQAREQQEDCGIKDARGGVYIDILQKAQEDCL